LGRVDRTTEASEGPDHRALDQPERSSPLLVCTFPMTSRNRAPWNHHHRSARRETGLMVLEISTRRTVGSRGCRLTEEIIAIPFQHAALPITLLASTVIDGEGNLLSLSAASTLDMTNSLRQLHRRCCAASTS
jgi:hypothetical protein